MKVSTTIKFDEEIKNKVQEIAKKKGINMTSYIMIALHEQLKKDEQ